MAVDTDRSAEPVALSTPRELDRRALAATEGSGRVTVIRPARRWPHLDLRELWHYRELLATFVWRDIKVRYKQTYVGVAWALLVPVFMAAVYIFFLGRFAKLPRGHLPYTVVVFSGILPMQYFTSSLTGSSTSIVAAVNLVTRVYFPRVLLPINAVIVPLVDFVCGLAVLLFVMGWYGTWPKGPIGVVAPLFLGLALLTVVGIGFFLSALNVRYRDVPYAIPVFVQVLPFLSGALFDVNDIPQKWQWILSLNPMTTVIAGWRWSLVGGTQPDLAKSAIGVAVGVLCFLGGLAFFRASEPRFADTI